MNREEAIMCLYAVKTELMTRRMTFEGHESAPITAIDMAIEALSAESEWIPVSERLPKKNEYVDDVCKYYLIQDEYGDMHVAHLSGRGWESIESIKILGCDVVAWMPLPEPYREDGE